jgi:hypothetical protein
MKDETKNDTNDQATVEQNQASGTPSNPATVQAGTTTPGTDAIESADGLPRPETKNTELVAGPVSMSTDPQPATNEVTPRRLESRGRVSKVSLLPLEIRESINEELLYGTPFFIIIKALEEKGYPGFNHMNLHSWHAHGFQTWLKNQQSIAQQMHRREVALVRAQNTGCQLDEALYQLQVEQLLEAASQCDPVEVFKTSKDKTDLFLKLNQACARLLKVGKGLRKSAPIQGSTGAQPQIQNSGRRIESNGGLTLGARAKVCKRLGIPHAPVRNPDAIEPEPEEKPATPPAQMVPPASALAPVSEPGSTQPGSESQPTP